MGKRGRDDSDEERDRRHSHHHKSKKDKKDKKHKADRSRSSSPRPAADAVPGASAEAKPVSDGDAAERKRKRLEAWKAMQKTTTVDEPAKPATAPSTVTTASKADLPPKPVAAGGGAFKMGMMKTKSKPGAFKMGMKPAAKPPSLFQSTEDDDKPKISALPPLNRQGSAGIFGYSPPTSPAPASPPGMSDLDDDIDPLDAFMTGISNEVKDSIGDCLPLAGPSASRQKEQAAEKAKLQTISMDDIMNRPADDSAMDVEEEDDDKLDEDRESFMDAIRKDREERARQELETKQKFEEAEKKQAAKAGKEENTGRFLDDEEEEEYWVDIEEEEQKYLDMLKKKKLAKELPPVDHEAIEYPEFQRKFYIESSEIKKMTADEVAAYRKGLDDTRIRGKDCPYPIKKWTQCGLPSNLLTVLKKHDYNAPFAIQCQALPAIMSGRDVIGVAKTGSGKTLAFVIPMLRHIKAQPPLLEGDGPIGLIMAPTRELAVQIFKETKLFCKSLNLNPVCAYGGAPMAQQVGDIKAGAEMVVCTPGRCIDLLTLNSGRVMNLQRCTYVVLDEADRMFDMGFEPQVKKIMNNIRPDRQTVMFSATFPKVVEKHAKSILDNPVQIICGGVSVVSDTITQHIEVIGAEAKNKRLLELLGDWYNLGDNILIFVDRQEDADELFRDLIKAGYVALTLHGGKDQNDRDHTLADFKNKDNTLMVATSVAARGLDVKDCTLVINYNCPNHYEDYVHRVGRTGRAGKKGTAYTFIEPEEDAYAPDMVNALKLAGEETIPEMLTALAEQYKQKEKAAYAMGTQLKRSSGYTSCKGFKFDEAEGKANKEKGMQARASAGVASAADGVYYDSDEDKKKSDEPGLPASTAAATMAPVPGAVGVPVVDASVQLRAAMDAARAVASQNAKVAAAIASVTPVVPAAVTGAAAEGATASSTPKLTVAETIARAQQAAAQIAQQGMTAAAPAGGAPGSDAARMVAAAQAKIAQINMAASAKANFAQQQQAALMAGMNVNGAVGLDAARAIAMQMSQKAGFDGPSAMTLDANGQVVAAHHQVELEINDYPQQARWKVTHKDSMNSITDNYAVCITTRGAYFQPGRNPPAGERKLYLTIEGADENNVIRAKRELRRMLEEAAAGVRDVGTAGRYSV